MARARMRCLICSPFFWRLFMKLIGSAAIRAVRQDAAMVRPEDLAAVYEEELNHFNGNFRDVGFQVSSDI